ncbi:hypothetical protein ABG768_017961, partial [Culter alburnus]
DREGYKFKCTTGTCHEVNGSFVMTESIKTCPVFNPNDCVPGTIQYDVDGCCQICEPSNCILKKNVTHLHVDGCTSIDKVEVTSCTGHCDSSSIYSMEKNIMMNDCSCCEMDQYRNKTALATCAHRSKKTLVYMYVESCKCTPTKCVDKKTSE